MDGSLVLIIRVALGIGGAGLEGHAAGGGTEGEGGDAEEEEFAAKQTRGGEQDLSEV